MQVFKTRSCLEAVIFRERLSNVLAWKSHKNWMTNTKVDHGKPKHPKIKRIKIQNSKMEPKIGSMTYRSWGEQWESREMGSVKSGEKTTKISEINRGGRDGRPGVVTSGLEWNVVQTPVEIWNIGFRAEESRLDMPWTRSCQDNKEGHDCAEGMSLSPKILAKFPKSSKKGRHNLVKRKKTVWPSLAQSCLAWWKK